MRVFLLALTLVSFAGTSAAEINIGPLNTVESQSFDEWINQDFHPPAPMTAYSTKDDSAWTGWNKFWFASAIGGQAADIVSTDSALRRGCTEGNFLFGKNPSTGALVLVKAGLIGVSYWATEYLFAGNPSQQDYRNWLYGMHAVLGFGAAGWNYSQDCE